jgi:Ca2+-binding RTX toxin-like protein
MYSHPIQPYVSIGHAATFSNDGEVMVFGHEPGGGTAPFCKATDDALKAKTYFFFYVETGTQIGEYAMPRAQSASENCTIHNFNVVPTANRDILVAGNYQAGISVVDFTNPGAAKEIAYADPAPLAPGATGGDWSTHWYDGYIYESDITRGLIVWKLSDPAVSGARTLGHLNPQTQEDIIVFTGKIGGGVLPECKGQLTTVFGTGKKDVLKGTTGLDVFSAGRGDDTIKAGKGKDIVCGGAGNDILRGSAGNDILLGQKGTDIGKGGKGKDTFKGGPGKDRGSGNERGKA